MSEITVYDKGNTNTLFKIDKYTNTIQICTYIAGLGTILIGANITIVRIKNDFTIFQGG
jgi:hypothetical protein